jgi:hypothetical protein
LRKRKRKDIRSEFYTTDAMINRQLMGSNQKQLTLNNKTGSAWIPS